MSTFSSGKNAQIRIGAGPTTLRCKKWTANLKVQKLEITNSESAGYGEYIGGIQDLDVTIEGDYYIGDSPIAAVTPGSLISTVKLYLSGTSGVYWNIPTLYVESFENGAEVRGLVTIKITGSASGTITNPAT